MNNLFLFTGPDTYTLHQQLKTWKKSFIQKHGDLNLDTLDADQIPLKDIEAALFTAPFLGEKRLIFIQNLPQSPPKRAGATKKTEKQDEDLKEFAKQLEQIPETSVVVFVQSNPDKRKSFYKTLSKLAELKTFEALQGSTLQQWLNQQVGKRALSASYPVINQLIEMTGGDLWKLSNELDKLAAYRPGAAIQEEDLKALITPVMESNIFRLMDALGARKVKMALHELHRLIDAGESLHAVMFMMVRQFRLLAQAKGYLQRGHNASDAKDFAVVAGLHPFVSRTVLTQQKAFDLKQIKEAYAKLLQIDEGMKTGKIRLTVDHQEPLALALEEFLLEFAVKN